MVKPTREINHPLKIEIMAQSRKSKKIMNMVYGLGAAIVILGALFKIQHISYGFLTGGVMLTIGLVVEAIVFAISAFEPVDDDLDWSKVYPELGDSEDSAGAQGLLSQKLDTILREAELDNTLIKGLGDSIKNFKGAAEGLSAVAETIASTNNYNEQMSKAAVQMESLAGLYQVQMENTSKQTELNNSLAENSEKLKEQMESLADNMASLNGVYGGMLTAMSSK
ncbi:MAG: gliding motility-associated protein GldL [Polaribacter sp.]|jgi:gliding motility-associated protein GldL